MTKKYNPNFNDKRIVKRINHALNCALANLSTTKHKQWSTRQIDTWFGSQHNNLSKLLRQHLLICTDPYYNPEQGISKKYLLNMEGVQYLGSKIGRNIIPCALHIQREKLASADTLYGNTIKSGNFQYRTKSHRMWNDIQNLDNATRRPLFANYGYIHEYDIRSAAPNILTQYAKKCGLDKPIPTLDAYLADIDTNRQNLANALECSTKTAKKLITSRFAGARFGAQNSIIKELDYNWLQYNRLKNNIWFDNLTQDITLLWKAIKSHDNLSRMLARTKWDIYFREEQRVMKSVHKYMDKTSARYFHEHDGWRCDTPIDLRSLKLHVHKQTGYWLDFDWEVFELYRYT